MGIKAAIVGAGGMLEHHIRGFRQAGAEITAIADIDPDAARAAAKRLDVPRSFGSVEELLAADGFDVVSLILPNKFHAPLSIECLKAGKHVFCEKPPALNAAEVEQQIAAARAADRQLMFNFNNRARPESYAMRKLIEQGVVGDINSAQAKWTRRTGIPGFGGWFTNRALSGGGPLIDLVHMIDLALDLMGYPEPAHVLGRTFYDFIDNPEFKGPWGIPDKADGVTDVESAAHGVITFKTGQILTFQVSWAEMVKREEVSVVFQGTRAGGKIERLFGTDGMDDTAIDTCELYEQVDGKSVNRQLEVEPCEDMGRARSAANFIRVVAGAEEPLNTPEQALALMRIIDAVYQSAETGQPVSL